MQWQHQQSSPQVNTVNPGAGDIHMLEINNSGSPSRGKKKKIKFFPCTGLESQLHAAMTAQAACPKHRAALVFAVSKALTALSFQGSPHALLTPSPLFPCRAYVHPMLRLLCTKTQPPGHLHDWQVLDAELCCKTDLPRYCSQHCKHCSQQSKRSTFPSCAFRPGRTLFNCTHDWKRSRKIRKQEIPPRPAPGREGAVTPGAAWPEPEP